MTQAFIEPQTQENPLREARLNDSRDFRPEWDVAALNAWVSKSLLQDIDRLAGRRDPDPGQMIPVLLSPGGYGKTHLFGRLAYELRDRAFFVFVGAIPDPQRPLEHIRWNVVESLFSAPAGKPSVLSNALAGLVRSSMVEYLRQFPPGEAARYQALLHELHEGTDAVLRIADSVKNLRSFQRLGESAAQVMPEVHASVIKALVLGWSPQQHLARRWLRGEGLTEDEARLVELEEQSAPPLQVLKGVAALLQHRKPMVICCDQLDSILNYPDGMVHLADQLMQLLAAVPCQFTALSCLENQWKTVADNKGLEAFRQRTHEFKLDFLTEDQALALLSKRLATWPGRKEEMGSLWPFDRESIANYVRDSQPTPRIFIKRCAREFDQWMDGDIPAPIGIAKTVVNDPLPLLFQKEWDRELESIRQNPRRAPDHIEEARLFKAMKELIVLAKSAGEADGPLKIEGYEFDDVLSSTQANPKYGLRLELTGKSGRVSVIVAASKVNGGARVVPFLKDLFEVATPCAGIVLVHPRSDFTMGPAARKMVDDAKAKGKLIIYALEDHPATFESLECALTLLEQAHSNDLVLGTTPISYEKCQSLILETKVIHQLDLLTTLASWNTPAETPVVASTESDVPAPAAPAGRRPAIVKTAPAESNGKKETAAKSKAPAKRAARTSSRLPAATSDGNSDSTLFPDTPQKPAPSVDDDTAWAAEKLALVAEKLTGWGQQVEADSFSIGPSFIRLHVRPAGSKTSFRKVCDRVTDLKTHLGLAMEPIIESHSYFFTIDVQRPHRQVVTLEQAMAQAPQDKLRDPIFPLGLDVAGAAHWMNLADPADCHLLVAGTTGSGKSEFLKSILASLAHRLTPEQVQFILIDPKRVTFNLPGSSPFLRHPIAYDLESALPLVKECEQETLRRYDMLQKMQKTDVGQLEESQASLVPRIVLIIDEFANLMEESQTKKALTGLLKRIGSMSRAAGIHLILATQRPDNSVIPMLVRSNLPGKIALQVDSEQNSKLILDSPAAAYLLGKGDLLCKRGGSFVRAQSPLVSQSELEKLLKFS